ncbi:MAG: pyridoxamine 5'-phosphate oxidase [Bacteroidetes bacterium]|nr:pyridoxamine 5'-phosphate oxidase [Bacteroidota bacterium]
MDQDQLAALRQSYTKADLSESSIRPDPTDQFDDWFQQALSAGIPEPNAMTLATATADGFPSARIVLLKSFDRKGYVFYTNYTSRKAEELAGNPRAALLFFWPELERQVRIEGRVEKVTTAESVKYFLSRPYGSQIGAWVSPQSSVITTRSLLEQKWDDMKRKFQEGKVPLPDFWGGYRVIPSSVEFWQGRPNRLHDRLRFRQSDGQWFLERLAP